MHCRPAHRERRPTLNSCPEPRKACLMGQSRLRHPGLSKAGSGSPRTGSNAYPAPSAACWAQYVSRAVGPSAGRLSRQAGVRPAQSARVRGNTAEIRVGWNRQGGWPGQPIPSPTSSSHHPRPLDRTPAGQACVANLGPAGNTLRPATPAPLQPCQRQPLLTTVKACGSCPGFSLRAHCTSEIISA
jgi:hypothetical protein